MSSVLIVEDSPSLAQALQGLLARELGVEAHVAGTLAEAEARLSGAAGRYDLALLDLTLPDAEGLEVVDTLRAHRVPAIVFTGAFSDEVRDQVLDREVVDYVVKDSVGELAYVVWLVGRFLRNATVEVLVVDDSATTRRYVAGLLRVQNFVVHEAESGERALAVLAEHPAVRLVITDFVMPGMDGCELITRLRRLRTKEALAIIGVSSGGGGNLSARFLKRGANDFLTRPFIAEEFLCRVRLNVEQLEQVAEIRNLTYRDPLTGLWNRRYFFERGARWLARARAEGRPVSLALVDVDHFKRVNDEHGHEVGDAALRHVARLLRDHGLEGEVVARIGGEEFCLLSGTSGEAADRHFEGLRACVAARPVAVAGLTLPLTISVGAAHGEGDLDELLRAADEALYQAKGGGRNRVVRSVRRAAGAPRPGA